MQRIRTLWLIPLVVAACGDAERMPGEAPRSDPVDLDTTAWFQEGRAVEHEGTRYVLVGPPVYEPLSLTRVGEFEGTPLYGERGVTAPLRRLYIPLGGGYWQMLERAQGELEAGAEAPIPPVPAEDGDTISAPIP